MSKLCKELKEKNKCKTLNVHCSNRCKEYDKLLCEKILSEKVKV